MKSNFFSEGIAYYKAKAYSEALLSFSEVVIEDMDNHKAWNALGNSYSALGEYEKAIRAFETALWLDSENITYKKNQQINLKRYEKFKVTQLISEQQYSPHNESQIKGYEINGYSRKNRGIYQYQAQDQKPVNKDTLSKYHVGVRSLHQKHYKTAIQSFTEHLLEFPEDSKSWNALGITYFKEEYEIKAKECLKKALEFDPSNNIYKKNLEKINKRFIEITAPITLEAEEQQKKILFFQSPIIRIIEISLSIFLVFSIIVGIPAIYLAYDDISTNFPKGGNKISIPDIPLYSPLLILTKQVIIEGYYSVKWYIPSARIPNKNS